jgi:ABC-type branched-subunit amino acid transport system permease subunit
MDLLPTVLIVGFASILLSLILARYSKDRLSLLVFLFTILIFAVCIIGFYYAMSEVANQTVGSFAGSGNLEVDIPGENQYETLSCSWGPNLGFYLLLVSICTLIFAFYLDIRMTIIKKSKKVKQ